MTLSKVYSEEEISNIINSAHEFIANHLYNYNYALKIIVCEHIICSNVVDDYRTHKHCTFKSFIDLLSKSCENSEYEELVKTHDEFHELSAEILNTYSNKIKISEEQFEKLYTNHNKLISLLNQIINKFESSRKDLDSLTNIWTRKAMLSILNREYQLFQKENNSFTIVYMDIDYFKQINDTFSHDGGDFVLKELTKLIRDLLRKNDVISRWGGEEFLLLLPQTSANEAYRIIHRIKNAISEKVFLYMDKTIQLTCSFGLCEATLCKNIEQIITSADKYLYKAKQNGRNQIVM